MSYNGIGLSSAKGSSTSGHIQRNISRIQKPQDEGKQYLKRQLLEKKVQYEDKQQKLKTMTVDKDILDHDRRREIEVKVSEYRDQLEDEETDLSDDEIEKRVNEYRQGLLKQREMGQIKPYNSKVNPFSTKDEKDSKDGS